MDTPFVPSFPGVVTKKHVAAMSLPALIDAFNSDHAEAIVFDFMNPPWAGGRFFRRSRPARLKARMRLIAA